MAAADREDRGDDRPGGCRSWWRRSRQFRAHSGGTQAARRRTRSEFRLRELVSHRFMEHLERDVLAAGELGAIVDRIAAREVDPYTAANDLLSARLDDDAQTANHTNQNGTKHRKQMISIVP